jgi:Uma2 family endonuclease
MITADLMTFEEFEQLPESPGKQELLDGELIELPPARLEHVEIGKRLQQLLETVLHRSRVWVETGYRTGTGWLQPDISVSWPDQPRRQGYFDKAPMLAVEVASRGYTSDQMDRKIARYFSEGASEVWIIHEKTTSMTVCRADRTGEILSRRITGTYECQIISDLKVIVPDLILGS